MFAHMVVNKGWSLPSHHHQLSHCRHENNNILLHCLWLFIKIIDKYKKGAGINYLAAGYYIVKSTVVTIMNNKEAIQGADVTTGEKATKHFSWDLVHLPY